MDRFVRLVLLNLVCMFAVLVVSVHAQTYIWTGADGGDWGTASNWSGNVVPGGIASNTQIGQISSNNTVNWESSLFTSKSTNKWYLQSIFLGLETKAAGEKINVLNFNIGNANTVENTGALIIGRKTSTGTLNMQSGTLNIGGVLLVGCNESEYLLNKGSIIQTGGTIKVNNTTELSGRASGNGVLQVSNGSFSTNVLCSAVDTSKVALNDGSTGLLEVSGTGQVSVGSFALAKGTTINVSGGSLNLGSDSEISTMADTNITVSGGVLNLNGKTNNTSAKLTDSTTLTNVNLVIDGGTVNSSFNMKDTTVVTDSTQGDKSKMAFMNNVAITVKNGGTLNAQGGIRLEDGSSLTIVDGTVNLGSNSILCSNKGGSVTIVGDHSTINMQRFAINRHQGLDTQFYINFMADQSGMKTIAPQSNSNVLSSQYSTTITAGVAGGLALMSAKTYNLITGINNTEYSQVNLGTNSVWKLSGANTATISAELDSDQKLGTITLTGNDAVVTLANGTTLGQKGWFEVRGDGGNINYEIGFNLLDGTQALTFEQATNLTDAMSEDSYGFLSVTPDANGTVWMTGLNASDSLTKFLAVDFTPYSSLFTNGLTIGSVEARVVPEPAAWVLLVLGAVGVMASRRKK